MCMTHSNKASAAGRSVDQVRNMARCSLISFSRPGPRPGADKTITTNRLVLLEPPHRAQQKHGHEVKAKQVNEIDVLQSTRAPTRLVRCFTRRRTRLQWQYTRRVHTGGAEMRRVLF